MVLAIKYLGPSIMSFLLRKASASCAVGRKKGAFGLGSIVLSSISLFFHFHPRQEKTNLQSHKPSTQEGISLQPRAATHPEQQRTLT